MNDFNSFDKNILLQEQMREFRKRFTTPASIKWGIILAFGVLPMTIAWILFGGDPNGSNSFFNINNGYQIIEISYGYQWLIAIGITLGSFIIGTLFIKFRSEIKGDVYGNLIALDFVIINFWLFNIGAWVLLTAILMYILGYIVALSLRFFMFLIKTRSNFKKVQSGDISSLTKTMSPQQIEMLKRDFERLSKMYPSFKNPFDKKSEEEQKNTESKKNKDIKIDKNNTENVIDAKEVQEEPEVKNDD